MALALATGGLRSVDLIVEKGVHDESDTYRAPNGCREMCHTANHAVE
jgi:hypothetical protein